MMHKSLNGGLKGGCLSRWVLVQVGACPGGQLSWVAIVQGWQLSRGGNCPGVEIVQGWKLSRGGNCPGVEIVQGWKLSRGGNCPGVEIVQGWKLSRGGNCPGVEIVQGGNCPGWKLSRGGNCPDGYCPSTDEIPPCLTTFPIGNILESVPFQLALALCFVYLFSRRQR